MGRHNFSSVFFVLLMFCSRLHAESPTATSNDTETKAMEQVAQGNSKFATELYEALKTKTTSEANLIVSPFSLSVAMALLYLGADGKTATEIQNGLNFPSDVETLTQGFSRLLSFIKTPASGAYNLTQASRLFLDSKFQVNAQYQTDLRMIDREARLSVVNFLDSVASAKEINEWAKAETSGKIQNVVTEADLSKGVAFILANAIYFKGEWKKPFKPEATRKAPFYLNEKGDTVQVDMMFQQSTFPYSDLDDLDSLVVSLPYMGDRLSMFVFVPSGKGGKALEKLENGLKSFNFSRPSLIRGQMRSRLTLQLHLPKFKIESTLKLEDALKSLGMQEAFDQDKANFAKITSSKGVYVSNVLQKAFIEVDERGSEAGAVTLLEAVVESLPPTIIADRPFLFQIVDHQADVILFTGRVMNPLQG